MLQDIANHLWQSTLFLMLIAVLCTYLRKEDARVRYALWCIGSMKFLLPFSLLTSIGSWLSPRAPIESIDLTIDWVASVSAVSQPFTPQQQSWSVSSMILAVWAVGSFLVLGVWAVRAYRLRQLIRGAKQESKPLSDQGRVIPVYRTQADIEPGVVGLLRPVILLPQGIENRLSTTQFEAVLAHELCHIRRRDNLTAAVHMLVQAVFWFHPIIWWVGSRLIDERERACDELVVSLGHDREAYAKSILDVCEQYVATRLACAPGISGSDLKRRVVEIMHYEGVKKMENTKKILLSTLSALVLALPILGGLSTNPVALAQEQRTSVPESVAVGTLPVSTQTFRVLEAVRLALAPQRENEGDPRPAPNPRLALQELDSFNLDRLPGNEKAEVYNYYAMTYTLLEDYEEAMAYMQRIVDEPEASSSLVARTRYRVEQLTQSLEPVVQADEVGIQNQLEPKVAITPNYPARAVERGIEGYCVVSFIITTAGTTRDVQEVECTNVVFSLESIRAAEHLVYDPVIIESISNSPVAVRTYYKFSYEMASEAI